MKPHGILWYVPPKGDLVQEVARAAERHLERLGQRPNVVYLRPDVTDLEELSGLQVRVAEHITPSHIWVCVDPALPIRQPEPEPSESAPVYQQTAFL